MNDREIMNSKQLDNETLADFLDGTLSPQKLKEVERLLQGNSSVARDAQELSEVLQLLHQLPQREPVLDVWPELEPKLEIGRAHV